MENLENNELEPTVTTTKKTKIVEPEYTWLEKEIMGRREYLNFPALQAMFELNETQLQEILDKLPPAGCSTC